jgi:hypothetical protein
MLLEITLMIEVSETSGAEIGFIICIAIRLNNISISIHINHNQNTTMAYFLKLEKSLEKYLIRAYRPSQYKRLTPSGFYFLEI